MLFNIIVETQSHLFFNKEEEVVSTIFSWFEPFHPPLFDLISRWRGKTIFFFLKFRQVVREN